MKELKYYLGAMVLAFCLFFVACSDDDKEAKPVFPELQKVECEVGDEKTLTFEASGDWTLTSSALWCTFANNNEQVHSCSGGAGKQSVTIHVSDDATLLMKSYKAELNLMMGGSQQVIFEVTRPSTGYELHAFDAAQEVEYTAENPYVQNYTGSKTFVVTANTDWVLEPSENLVFEESTTKGTRTYGYAGETVSVLPTLKAGFTYRKEAWKQELVFKDKEGTVIAKLPVHYDGIPADKVEFSIDNPSGTTITFAHNGYSYKIGEGEQSWAPMPLEVMARNNQYTLVYVDYVEEHNDLTWEIIYTCTRMSEEESWVWVDDDKEGNLGIGMTSNEGLARTAYLMAIPNAVYETLKDNFEAEVFSKNEGVKSAYSQYIAARLTQEANPKFTTGFVIGDMEGNPLYDAYDNVVEAYSYMDAGGEMSEEELIGKYGTSNVYILSLPLGVSYDNIVVKPNGFTGYYLQPVCDTQWEGVEVMSFSMLETLISGINDSINGNQMEISFMDPNGGTYAVLFISRY